MKVLFDTNVVLDVLLAREPFASNAAELMTLADRRNIDGVLGATTVTTIHYLAAKVLGRRRAQRQLRALFEIFSIAPVTEELLHSAMELPLQDFEDAVLHEAARSVKADCLVTRNTRDFKKALLPMLTPSELLAAIRAL